MSCFKKVAPVIALAVLMEAGSAYASGFQISESSVTALGRAFGGAGIVGDDASAIAYNPAGMSLTEGTVLQAGATAINIRSKVHGVSTRNIGGSVSGSTDPNITAIVPNAFLIHRYNDKINLGIYLFNSKITRIIRSPTPRTLTIIEIFIETNLQKEGTNIRDTSCIRSF